MLCTLPCRALDEGEDEQNEGLAMSFRKREDLLVFDGIAALATGKTSREVLQGFFNGSRIPHRRARLHLQPSASFMFDSCTPKFFPILCCIMSNMNAAIGVEMIEYTLNYYSRVLYCSAPCFPRSPRTVTRCKLTKLPKDE